MTEIDPQNRHLGDVRVSTYGQDAQLVQLRAAGCAGRPARAFSKCSMPSPLGIVKRIADAKAQFRPLAEPWVDTGASPGRLMLAVLGGLADVERDLIRTRTAEGQGSRQGPRATDGPSTGTQ